MGAEPVERRFPLTGATRLGLISTPKTASERMAGIVKGPEGTIARDPKQPLQIPRSLDHKILSYLAWFGMIP
jgi:hypothetical protein